ncbi:MAG: cytochrome b5-like heme/steroid binding domain-containing protein [Candidatus Diapherotrites archaeon]
MKNELLLSLILLVFIFGCIQGNETKDQAINSNKESGNEFHKACEIEKEYQNTAVNPIQCNCPEGYEFKVVRMGWGPCQNEEMSDCPASTKKCIKTESSKSYSLTEISEHNSSNDCWLAINGKVYEVTEFIPVLIQQAIKKMSAKFKTSIKI